MPINRAVLNASPLICLQKSGLSGLLPKLFSDIIVTSIVKAEVLAKGTVDVPMEALFANDWFRIADVAIDPDIAAWGLGRGEESVLSYALHDRSCWAVIDDRVALRWWDENRDSYSYTYLETNHQTYVLKPEQGNREVGRFFRI